MRASGRNVEDIIDRLGGGVPEGVKSAAVLYDLAIQQGFTAPLAQAVHQCINHPSSVPKFLHDLWKPNNGKGETANNQAPKK
jgi:glycerol-3-phosphate dehydrogenase